MRGHKAIIALRLRGYCPQIVWVSLLNFPCQTRFFLDAENTIELSGMAQIDVGVDEDVNFLDFRCLHGVVVALHGLDDTRLQEAKDRIMQFSPKSVVMPDATVLVPEKKREEAYA